MILATWRTRLTASFGLYRDEMHHPDTDNKHLAEVVVLKKRQLGEDVGCVRRLTWLGEKYADFDWQSVSRGRRLPSVNLWTQVECPPQLSSTGGAGGRRHRLTSHEHDRVHRPPPRKDLSRWTMQTGASGLVSRG